MALNADKFGSGLAAAAKQICSGAWTYDAGQAVINDVYLVRLIT